MAIANASQNAASASAAQKYTAIAQAALYMFDTTRLLAAASFIKQQDDKLEDCIGLLGAKPQGVAKHWVSAVQEVYAGHIAKATERGAELRKQLNTLISELKSVAGIYQQSEAAVEDVAEALPTEGVFTY